MDFSMTYTQEQETFAAEVRKWAKDHVPAGMSLLVDAGKLTDQEHQRQRLVGRELGKKGWLAPMYPEQYGGGGLSIDLAVVLQKELYRFGVDSPPYYDVGLTLAAPAIFTCGTPEQKEVFLTPMLKGEKRSWQLFTEPEAGSDLANVQTTAIRQKDHFVLNGRKLFAGSTHKPEQFWVLAKTDPDGLRHKNLGMFIIPFDTPGITIQQANLVGTGDVRPNSSGIKNTIVLDHVKVPEFNLIGGENNGWTVATATLEIEHGNVGRIQGNPVAEAFFHACKTDPYIKKRLKENGSLVDQVTDLYVSAEIEHLLSMRNFWIRYNQSPRSYEGNQYAIYEKRFNYQLSSVMLNVLGPYALTDDDRWNRVKVFEAQQRSGVVSAPGGTIDIQKLQMARRLGIGRSVKAKAARVDI